jgi:hypothetical protein
MCAESRCSTTVPSKHDCFEFGARRWCLGKKAIAAGGQGVREAAPQKPYTARRKHRPGVYRFRSMAGPRSSVICLMAPNDMQISCRPSRPHHTNQRFPSLAGSRPVPQRASGPLRPVSCICGLDGTPHRSPVAVLLIHGASHISWSKDWPPLVRTSLPRSQHPLAQS